MAKRSTKSRRGGAARGEKTVKKKPAVRRGTRASDRVRPVAGESGAEDQAIVSSIELARRAMHQKAERDRKERVAEYKKSLRDAKTRGLRLGPSGELRVLAEGDSWFDYPKILGTGGGVVSHLSSMAGIRILNMAHYGDEVRAMMGLEQRQRLEGLLRDRELGTFDVLLFSGGGNDIVGDHMVLWTRRFREGMPLEDAVDVERFRDVMAMVEMGYRDLVAIRDELSPETHIVTHSYDFPTPSTKGVCGVGPWLKPSLDYKGWKNGQGGIVRAMLAEFDRLLRSLAASAPRVTHVSTQGLLAPSSDWHNEIHPNRAGYDKVARAINNELAKVMPRFFSTR